jgi:urease accessory protein
MMNARALSASEVAPARGWQAQLDLAFECVDERTRLTRRTHVGPLRVQKALYPEGPNTCHAVLVHPPGGIVGGDELAIDVTVGEHSHALLTTPGATKWYRSAGELASLRTKLAVAKGGVLEWLPQETLVFDGARAKVETRVELAYGACLIGWDVVVLGRTASGERFASGEFRQSLEIWLDGELAWCERAVLAGGSRALHSGALLAGAPVFATLLVAGAAVDDGQLAACRAVAGVGDDAAVTRLPHVLCARYRGDSAQDARTYLASLWRALRPACIGRAAVPPRIWST